jgi:hypothetical protein
VCVAAMPESREEHGHYLVFEEKFQSLKAKTSFQLLGIHADASKPEEKNYAAKDGHVIQLSPDCNIARGTCGLQSYVWPPKFARTVENPDPLPINTLTLFGAHSSNRAIILDFDTYFLKVIHFIYDISIDFIQIILIQVAYLTHTSIQFYSRKVWTESILGVSKHVSSFIGSSSLGLSFHTYGLSKDRGFHVGLALEFADYFIAFLSNDLVFQVSLVSYSHFGWCKCFFYSQLGVRHLQS